jgi:exopolysaccharide biosynthesis polyprenyl glycosylphosphotransferase
MLAFDLLLDSALIYIGFGLAWVMRYQWEIGGHVLPWDYEPFSTFQRPALALIAITLIALALRGSYRQPRGTGLLDHFIIVGSAVTTAMGGLVLFAFLLQFSPSRLVFIFAWALVIVLLWLRRLLSLRVQQSLWEREIGVTRVLVAGSNAVGRRAMQAIVSQPSLGYRLVGFVDDGPDRGPVGVGSEHRVIWPTRLGEVEDIEAVVANQDVDEVVIAIPSSQQEQILSIIEHCRQEGVAFKVVPDLVQLSLDRVDLGNLAGLPLIGMKEPAITGWNYMLKRVLDIVVALIVLTIFSLPMAIIALLIKRDSEGPVIFRQERVGRDGKSFTITKFRCMVNDAEAQRAALMEQSQGIDLRLFKMENDPRVTSTGRWLRRWSLDELPQFWQVLTGEMSVVGPRPQLVEEVERYEEWHRQRLHATPGLTGLWQINGRSDLSFDEMVRLDLFYAEHWSLWLDIKVMLRTVPAVVRGSGAY